MWFLIQHMLLSRLEFVPSVTFTRAELDVVIREGGGGTYSGSANRTIYEPKIEYVYSFNGRQMKGNELSSFPSSGFNETTARMIVEQFKRLILSSNGTLAGAGVFPSAGAAGAAGPLPSAGAAGVWVDPFQPTYSLLYPSYSVAPYVVFGLLSLVMSAAVFLFMIPHPQPKPKGYISIILIIFLHIKKKSNCFCLLFPFIVLSTVIVCPHLIKVSLQLHEFLARGCTRFLDLKCRGSFTQSE